MIKLSSKWTLHLNMSIAEKIGKQESQFSFYPDSSSLHDVVNCSILKLVQMIVLVYYSLLFKKRTGDIHYVCTGTMRRQFYLKQGYPRLCFAQFIKIDFIHCLIFSCLR